MSFVARNHPQQVQARGAVDAVDDRRTPDDLFAECMALTGAASFDLDPCATPESARASAFITREQDGLAQDWFGVVWMNPPYSDLAAWVEKASREVREGRCRRVVALIPANRTEQSFWHEHIEPYRGDSVRVRFLPRRRRFDRPGWTKPKKGDRPPFGLCLVTFGADGLECLQ